MGMQSKQLRREVLVRNANDLEHAAARAETEQLDVLQLELANENVRADSEQDPRALRGRRPVLDALAPAENRFVREAFQLGDQPFLMSLWECTEVVEQRGLAAVAIGYVRISDDSVSQGRASTPDSPA